MATANPLDMCLEGFHPVTDAQRQFVEKVEALVERYTEQLVTLIYTPIPVTISTTKITEVGSRSCKSNGFIARRVGFPVMEHEGNVLFYDYFGGSSLFTIVKKCPHPLEVDGDHYHMAGVGWDDSEGSDQWKKFPTGDVLTGLGELLTRLLSEQESFVRAAQELDDKFSAALVALEERAPNPSSPAQ